MSYAAIQAYTEVLSSFGEVIDFDISALDRLDVPVTSCSLQVAGRLRHHGNGYGETPAAARLSGWVSWPRGCCPHGISTGSGSRRSEAATGTWSRRRVGTGCPIRPPCGLPAGSPYSPTMPLSWVPLERCRTGETVWVPLDLVASDPAEIDGPGLVVPVTNGLGAGLDPDRPVAHGIGEILQRHTNGLRFRAPGLPLSRDRARAAAAGGAGATAAVPGPRRSPGVQARRHRLRRLLDLRDGPRRRRHRADPADRLRRGRRPVRGAESDQGAAGVRQLAGPGRRFCFGDRTAARAVAPLAYWDGLVTSEGEPRAVTALQAWADLPVQALRELTAPDRSRTVGYDEIGTPTPTQGLDAPADQLAALLAGLDGFDVLTARSEVGGVVAAKTIVSGWRWRRCPTAGSAS